MYLGFPWLAGHPLTTHGSNYCLTPLDTIISTSTQLWVFRPLFHNINTILTSSPAMSSHRVLLLPGVPYPYSNPIPSLPSVRLPSSSSGTAFTRTSMPRILFSSIVSIAESEAMACSYVLSCGPRSGNLGYFQWNDGLDTGWEGCEKWQGYPHQRFDLVTLLVESPRNHLYTITHDAAQAQG